MKLLAFAAVMYFVRSACPGDLQCRSCSKDGSSCDTCVDGFTTTNGCDINVDKIANCQNYDSKNVCSECEWGYALKANACSGCKVSGCALCDDLDKCNACFNSILTDGTSCDSKLPKCGDSNCAICEAADVCNSCKNGFAVNSSNKCETSVNNCLFIDGGKCKTCQSGYYLTTAFSCETAPTRATGHKLLWILVALLIIALIVLIIYFATKKRDSDAYARAEPN